MITLSITLPLELSSIAALHPWRLVLALGVGLIGGATSGLCGVSPGGILVVLGTLFLGAEQHFAQGMALAAQVPPTSLAAIRRYQASGGSYPRVWLPWLASGFLIGGAAGAIGAARVSSSILQWSYVAYLGILDVLLLLRTIARPVADDTATQRGSIPVSALLMVGLLAGLSSGYLGIGGGLALIAGLTAGLKVPQHTAQHLSLFLSILPTTAPAAYVYWREGLLPSWPILAAVMMGLWGGTDLGARVANRASPTALRRVLVVMVTAMAVYMTWKALTGPSGGA